MLPFFVAPASSIKSIPLHILAASQLAQWLDSQSELLNSWLNNSGFTIRSEGICLIPNAEGHIARVVVIVNDSCDFWAAGQLAQQLPAGDYQLQDITDQKQLEQITCAWGIGAYRFDRYKTQAKLQARLILPATVSQAWLETVVTSIHWVRDLINTPAQDLGTDQLATEAQNLAKEFAATFEQIVGDDLLKHNYPAIHTVGRAGATPPRLLDLRWGEHNAPKVTLVGKGVCFDTGGLDIKTGSSMGLMKKDMGGAAHVLGLARLIMASQLAIRLRVLIPAVENNIAANAYRPGDVIETRQGLTVEVTNTDAEGRLVLADALTEAATETPDLIFDFATLTGAARVALGPDLPVLFSNNETLAVDLLEAAQLTQDPCWRLPLHTPYRQMLDSNIADISNASSTGYAGAITAALFLQEFVAANQAWAHFDIMAWNPKARPGRPEGGEAMLLRAVYHYLKRRYTE